MFFLDEAKVIIVHLLLRQKEEIFDEFLLFGKCVFGDANVGTELEFCIKALLYFAQFLED